VQTSRTTEGQQHSEVDLVDLVHLAHRRLDVQGAHVLPSLLEEGDQEVDGELDVESELVSGHANVSDGNTHAEHLLELELDGASKFVDLGLHVISMVEQEGKLAGLVETWSEEPGDQSDDGFRSKESIVCLGQFLDCLLVPVDFLEVFNGHGGNVGLLGLIDMGLVSQDADLEGGLGGIGKTHGAAETLVLLGIVVLQANLELDGLDPSSLGLCSRSRLDLIDVCTQACAVDLAAGRRSEYRDKRKKASSIAKSSSRELNIEKKALDTEE
jgi:hypothetical protein